MGLIFPQARAIVSNTRSNRNEGFSYFLRWAGRLLDAFCWSDLALSSLMLHLRRLNGSFSSTHSSPLAVYNRMPLKWLSLLIQPYVAIALSSPPAPTTGIGCERPFHADPSRIPKVTENRYPSRETRANPLDRGVN
jgi:hypothetical protein